VHSTDLTFWCSQNETCHDGLVVAMKNATKALLAAAALSASAVYGDTLHGFCYSPTPDCLDNLTNTPTSTDPPNFGFRGSGKSVTGDYLIELLIPNNALNANTLSFSVSGTEGVTNLGPFAAALFSTTAFTSGSLDTYLGINASPADGLSNFLTATQALDAGATGYFVYQADLGQQTLLKQSDELNGPLLTLNNALPTGSFINAFVNDGTPESTNANSGAIFETGKPPAVPEPSYTLLLTAGIVLFGFIRKVRARA
jgi:hypothetical protein